MEDRIVQLYAAVLHHRRHAFPPHFFCGREGMRRAATILRYVVEEKKKWNREQICLEISHDLFAEFRLAGMLKTYFQRSVFAALDNAYPNEFQPWELVRARRHVFAGPAGRETARRAVRWMVCERLSHVDSTLEKITVDTFKKYHLHQLLFTFYGGSPLQALQDAGVYQERPWLTGHTPNGYWQGPTGRMHAIAAVRWLIEDQLRLIMDEIPIKIRFRDFKDHGLDTMIKSVFNGSPYLAIDAVYPGKFKRWQFASVGNGYWTGENGLQHAKEAMDWLIHEKLNIPVQEIPALIGEETLKKHGLGGMLTQLFNRSVTKALNVLYPGQFTTQDLIRAKRGRTLI